MENIFRSKITRIVLWSLGILIAIILLLDKIVPPWYVNHGGTLPVPDVVGMQEADAIRVLDSLSLEPRRGEVTSGQRLSGRLRGCTKSGSPAGCETASPDLFGDQRWRTISCRAGSKREIDARYKICIGQVGVETRHRQARDL